MKNLKEFDHLKTLEKMVETEVSEEAFMVARLDGNNFSRFTKGIKRPFDPTFRESMADVTKALMIQFGATVGFTQSDEITLIWEPRRNKNDTGWVSHPRSGRVLKLSTLMSSYCSLEFYKLIHLYKSDNYNGFDCRMYGGDKDIAIDSLRFRFLDASSNSYQQIAQSMWSQKQLNGVTVQQIKQKLKDAGINVWQDYGDEAMTGTYFRRETILTPSDSHLWYLNGMVAQLGKPTKTIVRRSGADMMRQIKNETIFKNT